MRKLSRELSALLAETFGVFRQLGQDGPATIVDQELGVVTMVGQGVAQVRGLPSVQLEELVEFESGLLGMVFNLEPDHVGVVLLGESAELAAGSKVFRTGRVMDIPVGQSLVGRVIDATGQPLDGRGPVRAGQRLPIERAAPPIIQRAPVTVPLQTGIKVIDALLPIGRGQRELILGDRQTGKTVIALDTILNQRDKRVLCIYCAIGQRSAAVAKVIDTLQSYGALHYTTVLVASGEEAPGLQYVAPYAATTIAEYFMQQGHDVLIVYDDLTHHARAYRELTLLLRRPPGREAYPGDIFYIHSRLLERATRLRPDCGGGSLTALPIVETQAQDISSYIPTNLISITDGQIYLSPLLFQKGMMPAVEVGRSVSRVGGQAQLPAYRAVAGPLRLAYNQFEELEIFSRFSTRLDEATRRTIEHGRHVREILKQPQYSPIPVAAQIASLFAVTSGLLDHWPLAQMRMAEAAICQAVADELPNLSRTIARGAQLTNEEREALLAVARRAIGRVKTLHEHDSNRIGRAV
ncbi:MAG TPA: alternate F1F0 ATPase, F1 subunit alpha [Caldilineaceae bacterium]|nr:alternate F1F0 ATPase, F1 subunit alpha [Caldilineaceae bacterium]